MYSYESFTSLRGPHLVVSRLSEGDFAEAARELISPTTWAAAVRGIDSAAKMDAYLAGFLAADRRGESLSLVARVHSSAGSEAGALAAISRFHSAGPGFLRVEIGYTWVADKWKRTFVNTELKRLLVIHAFETMGVRRVEFSVDPRNDGSNAAMKRLGATFEGTLRRWRFLNESDRGDRNIYSFIDDELPQLRARFTELEQR